MLIDPKTAINEGWLVPTASLKVTIEKCLQPNAIDIDCESIVQLDRNSPAMLSEESKILRRGIPVPFTEHDSTEYWLLRHGESYDFTSSFHITLDEGVAAELIIRSTLNRCGVFLTSGLYDSGYSGGVAGVLHVRAGDFLLARGTRIGQLKLIRSEVTGRRYAGGYNHAIGTPWRAN